MFLDYLKKEYSAENLEFWKKVEQYRHIETRALEDPSMRQVDDIKMEEKEEINVEIIHLDITTTTVTRQSVVECPSKLGVAKAIYVDYVATNAVHMINISSGCRETLINWYTNITSSNSYTVTASSSEILDNLFNESQREIFDMMCGDSFMRFMKTSECQKIQKEFNSHYLFGLRTKNSITGGGSGGSSNPPSPSPGYASPSTSPGNVEIQTI